jgi:hypothetical protein
MEEIIVKLTEYQARLVVIEFERIAETSEDDGYRLKASQILRRFEKARSNLTRRAAELPSSAEVGAQADDNQNSKSSIG